MPSERTDIPLIQAAFLPLAMSFAAMINAHAPSEEGQLSRYRNGSHSMGVLLTISKSIPGICKWANGLRLAFCLSLTATCQPICSGAPDLLMYSLM